MRYIVLLSGLLYILSCSKSKSDNGNDDCPDHIYEYTAKEQSVLDTTWTVENQYIQVEQGSNIVFVYKHISDRCGMAYDAGYAETLAMEIPAGVNRFSYTNDELKTKVKTFYQMSCFCNDTKAHPVVQGTIEGHKINADTWSIKVNVMVPIQNKLISFNKSFKVQ